MNTKEITMTSANYNDTKHLIQNFTTILLLLILALICFPAFAGTLLSFIFLMIIFIGITFFRLLGMRKTEYLSISFHEPNTLHFTTNAHLLTWDVRAIRNIRVIAPAYLATYPGTAFAQKDISIKIGATDNYIIALDTSTVEVGDFTIYLSVPNHQLLLDFLQEISQIQAVPFQSEELDESYYQRLELFSFFQSSFKPTVFLAVALVLLNCLTFGLTRSNFNIPAELLFACHIGISLVLCYLFFSKQISITIYPSHMRVTRAGFISFLLPYGVITDYKIQDKYANSTNDEAIGFPYKTISLTLLGNSNPFNLNSPFPQEIIRVLDIGTADITIPEKEQHLNNLALSILKRKNSQKNSRTFPHLVNIALAALFILYVVLTPFVVLAQYNPNNTTSSVIVEPEEIVPEPTSIDVFQYAHLYYKGVEGQLDLSMMRYRDDSAKQLTKEQYNYISEGTFWVNDIEIPQEFSSKEYEAPLFDLYENDQVTVRFEPNLELQEKYNVAHPTYTKTIELSAVGQIISEQTINQYTPVISKYHKKLDSFVMNQQHTTVERFIRDNKLQQVGIYYKLDPTYANTKSSTLHETSGMTIMIAYENDGKIYLRGRTNIYGIPYNIPDISHGANYYFENLHLTEAERTSEQIDQAMQLRGYHKL